MSQLDVMFNEQRLQQQAAESNKVLRRVEHEHGRTMALLSATLAELRKVVPDSLVLIPQVQEKIRASGGWTIDRARHFQAVWDLEFDLPSILVQVQKEHEEAKAVVVKQLEAAKVVERRFFWRPWRKYGRVAGSKFSNVEAAEAARLQALELAKGAKLGGRARDRAAAAGRCLVGPRTPPICGIGKGGRTA